MNTRKSKSFAFQFVKAVLQTIARLMQHTALETQTWSVKCTTIRYSKISSISIPFHQALQAITIGRLGEKKPLQNAFKCISIFVAK